VYVLASKMPIQWKIIPWNFETILVFDQRAIWLRYQPNMQTK
jgi:glutathione peroxidase-family protein